LQERDDRLCAKENNRRRPSYYFDTSFIRKFIRKTSYTYSKRDFDAIPDLFEKDKLFMPISSKQHLSMVVVFIQKKEIRYYCSSRGIGTKYLGYAMKWLTKQAKTRFNFRLKKKEWKFFDGTQNLNVPQQPYWSKDCARYTMAAADYLSDDLPLVYCQEDIDEYRFKIAYAMLKSSISY
jgi:Ulp1 family protease